jgi:prepilin-type N-terminal cleavage/methylation domain-containing protein
MRSRFGRGMTLIEILVVVAVILILSGVVISVTQRVDNQAKEKAVRNVFSLLKGALTEYYDANDAFPLQPNPAVTTADAMAHMTIMYVQLTSIPASRQILRRIDLSFTHGPDANDIVGVYDPWRKPIDYRYRSSQDGTNADTFPVLTSAGPDKKFGTADDISSR